MDYKNENIKICCSCKHGNLSSVPYNYDFLEGVGKEVEYRVSVCADCGHGVTNPRIEPSVFKNYYENVYRKSPKSGYYVNPARAVKRFSMYGYQKPRVLSGILTVGMFSNYLDEGYLDNGNPIKVLDVGCGSTGDAYKAFRRIFGDKVQYEGLESDPVSRAVLEPNGIPIVGNYVEDIADSGKIYDVVVAMGVLEHLNYDEAVDLVSALKDLMAEKSIIYVDVPNDDLRTMTDSTQGRFVPRFPHVQFFTRQSLKQMFDQAGFSVVFMGTAGKTIEELYGPGCNKQQRGLLVKRIINKACRMLFPRFILDHFRRSSEWEQLLDSEFIIYDAIKRFDLRAVAIKK